MNYGKRLITGIMGILSTLGEMNLFKQKGPSFVQGQRSGWAQKTKKGAQHTNRVIGNSAVGLYSRAHGVHWRKA